jgi:hypothetical protein
MEPIIIILAILGALFLVFVLSGGAGTDCSRLQTKNDCNRIAECTNHPVCQLILSK